MTKIDTTNVLSFHLVFTGNKIWVIFYVTTSAKFGGTVFFGSISVFDAEIKEKI